ncbi:FAD-dependent monooxygenase [Micromonospora sp. NPDC049175]|uniref:FAD-dependent monooxygenase n=1 Tax=Micromonospora sp. NPDC049175 TaxID=3364266 RepID=UPI003718D5A4
MTRVAIVGGGVAGLAVAALLRRHGMPYRIYEQAARFTTVGAGIQLSPNGVRILHRLGVGPTLREHGVAAESIETRRWDDGRLLCAVPHGEACVTDFGAPYVLIHRADLQRGLVGLLPAADLGLGRRVVRVSEDDERATLHLADGTRDTADLVIGADGVHSVVRPALIDDSPRYSGYAVWRGLLPVDEVPALGRVPRVLFWFGPDAHVTYYPIAARQTVHVSVVRAQSVETDDPGVEELIAALRGWHPEVRRVVGAARGVGRWGLYDRDIAGPWHSRRLVLLGDAAHPTLPYLSQGANQALEDALLVADLLAADPATALDRYERARRPRLAEVHRQARHRADLFHLPDGPAQRARDEELARQVDLNHLRWLYGHDPDADLAHGAPTGGSGWLGPDHRFRD